MSAATHHPTDTAEPSLGNVDELEDVSYLLAQFASLAPDTTLQAADLVLPPGLFVPLNDAMRAILANALHIATVVQTTAGTIGAGTSDVLALLEQLPGTAADTSVSALTVEQEAVLASVGSSAPRPAAPDVLGPEQAAVTARWQLVRTGRTVQDVADSLGVSRQRIRQRLTSRTLLGVHHSGTWVLPKVQFTADGGELPGWARVCAAVPPEAPLIAVEHLLTHPSVDLVLDGRHVSPSDWLTGGGDPAPVVALVADMLTVA